MHVVVRSVLCAAWSVFASAAAIAAADPGIGISLQPVPGEVTLSRPADRGLALTTYAAYRLTLSNGTTNALNRVFFNATVSYVGTTETVLIAGTVPAGVCAVSGAAIACNLGSLAPGAQATFHVVVQAPLAGSRIDIAGVGGGDEGKGGGNGCCDSVASASTTLVDPTTDTTYRTQATTFVRPGGGTLFTGDAAVATPTDGWTTLVTVPAFTSLPQTIAGIVETQFAGSCQPYALANGCFDTDLTIPGSFASLDISFVWDEDYFNLGATKPADVKLFYTGSNPVIAYPIQLALCSADALTYGSAPSPGRPCFAVAPKKLSKQDTPLKELWGDLKFRVLALDNGRYSM